MSLVTLQICALHAPASTLLLINMVRFWLDVPPQLIETVMWKKFGIYRPEIKVWKQPASFCRPRKKSRFVGPEIFLRFEADLDFSRPWFSEIKAQIKRTSVAPFSRNLNSNFRKLCVKLQNISEKSQCLQISTIYEVTKLTICKILLNIK